MTQHFIQFYTSYACVIYFNCFSLSQIRILCIIPFHRCKRLRLRNITYCNYFFDIVYLIFIKRILFFKKNYLFIWLCWVLVAAGGLLSCGMHVASSSWTRGGTQAPCIGSVES